MPRRDLTQERTDQILDAFERCIVKYGLEGSSLEKVAEEAEVKRPIIRHYIGNRTQLIEALTFRLVGRFRSEILELKDSLSESSERVSELVECLINFSEGEQSFQSVLVFENLILASATMESIRRSLSDWTQELVTMIQEELMDVYPSGKGHSEVALGIVSIYFNHVSLLPLQLPEMMLIDSRKACMRLVDSLAYSDYE